MAAHTFMHLRFRFAPRESGPTARASGVAGLEVTGLDSCAIALRSLLPPDGQQLVVYADGGAATVWHVPDGWIVLPHWQRGRRPSWADPLRAALRLADMEHGAKEES